MLPPFWQWLFYSFHYQIFIWVLIFKTTHCLYVSHPGRVYCRNSIFVVWTATLSPKVPRLLTSNGVCKMNILFFSSDFNSVLKMKQKRPKLCAVHSLMLKAPRQGKMREYHWPLSLFLGIWPPRWLGAEMEWPGQVGGISIPPFQASFTEPAQLRGLSLKCRCMACLCRTSLLQIQQEPPRARLRQCQSCVTVPGDHKRDTESQWVSCAAIPVYIMLSMPAKPRPRHQHRIETDAHANARQPVKVFLRKTSSMISLDVELQWLKCPCFWSLLPVLKTSNPGCQTW